MVHVLLIYIYGVTPAVLVLQAKRTIRNTRKRDVLDMGIWFSLILNSFSRLSVRILSDTNKPLMRVAEPFS